MNDGFILESCLDGKAQAECIVEAGMQLDAVGRRAADDAPVDGDRHAPLPFVVVADGEAGEKVVRAHVEIGV